MDPIKSDVRAHLLGLMQKAEDAKEDLRQAVESAAFAHAVDKGVLRKVVAAWHKDQTKSLREAAETTLDLLGEAADGR